MCAKRDRKPGFDSEFDGRELIVKLRGEIDHHSAAAVRTSLDEMIRSHAPKSLTLDMSGVDFMDSSGLGLIMGRYTLMQSLGGETCVLDPSPATERIIKVRRSDAARDVSSSRQRMGREVKRRSVCHRHGATAVSKASDGSKGETK